MKPYPPLKLINKCNDLLPSCWDEVEEFRKIKGAEVPDWDDSCYIPISATLAIISRGGNVTLDMIGLAAELASLAPWRQFKEAYRFSPEMEELLFEQADGGDTKIPIEIINNLPFPCIYIELNNTDELTKDIHGFFTSIEHDINTGRQELRFLILDDNGATFSIPLHLIAGGTIQDGINAMIKEAGKQKAKNVNIKTPFIYDPVEFNEITVNIVSKLLQLVLYICADNTEVEENPEQRKVTRRPDSQSQIKDKYREIRKWDVGIRTTKMIRNISSSDKYVHFNDNASIEDKTGTPKRPHARRGHWHHYWVGKRDSKDRKLILKWVAPTFINTDKANEAMPVVIREIDKEKDNK